MIDILYIISNRDIYNKYISYIKDNTLDDITKVIIKDIKTYYNNNPSIQSIDWDMFSTWFCVTQHADKPDTVLDNYRLVFTRLKTYVNTSGTEAIVKTFIDKSYATTLYTQCLNVAEGTGGTNMDKVIATLESYKKESGRASTLDKYILPWDIKAIMASTMGDPGLDWRLDCLNESLGPLRKGNFVVVGKRPDTGGTTFVASEASHMAMQLPPDKRILWINNEEAGKAVQLRVMQAVTGWTATDAKLDELAFASEYFRLVGSPTKICFLDKADVSVEDVDYFLKSQGQDIGVIFIDQLWKMRGFDSDTSDVGRQTRLFNTAREWSKTYAPVIAVHQLDGDAEGIRYPEMRHLYGSKTAIQGEVDAIIMIGRDLTIPNPYSRFIYLPKNKMLGGPKSNPTMRNGKYEVTIRPDIMRYED